MFGKPFQTLDIAFTDEEKAFYENEKANINKKLNAFNREAEKRAKKDKCYICGKECSSFCNSHSVPQFCLRRISTNGKVYFSGIQIDLPILGEDKGVNNAGTFHFICDDCDNSVFKDYETPNAYSSRPTGKMLAQIAMKNYLHIISQRLVSKERFALGEESFPFFYPVFQQQKKVADLDLSDYISAYERSKIAARGGHDDWYYLCYYKELDYVVPFTAQTTITLISDFEGNIINDIYNLSTDYHPKDLHIAVFPLENTSVILLFIDSRVKAYRRFYRQLNKLELSEQLAAINFIIHSYTENVFLSKSIPLEVLNDENFRKVCQKDSYLISTTPNQQPDRKSFAAQEFSLNKRNTIPNLLSKEFALT